MQANARCRGRRIVEMVREDLKPRQILTEGAFRNAIATVLAVSGSINAIKHLQATAIEAENGLDFFTMWEEMSRRPGALGGAPDRRGADRAVRGRGRGAQRCSSGSKPHRHLGADLHRQDARPRTLPATRFPGRK
jgi:hypothetical protein